MDVPSSHQSRMAIDSLLNPSADRHSDPEGYSRFPYAASSLSSSSLSPHRYPSSSNRYCCSQYSNSGYHQQLQNLSYSEGSRASSSLIPPSVEPSPGPYSQDCYEPIFSSSSIITPTTTASSSSTRASTESISTATTTSSSATSRRRPPRPKYEEEEMYFIWYHRIDLCQDWKEVRECFNRQFPNRQRSGFQGIQCKFYRFIRDKKCPTLREQRQMRGGEFLHQGSTPETNNNNHHPVLSEIGPPKFGVVEWMGVWYPWMRENPDQVRMMARTIST